MEINLFTTNHGLQKEQKTWGIKWKTQTICLSFTELKERFDVKANLLVYHGLVSRIKLLRNAIENQTDEMSALL